jgi:hypothetical protein
VRGLTRIMVLVTSHPGSLGRSDRASRVSFGAGNGVGLILFSSCLGIVLVLMLFLVFLGFQVRNLVMPFRIKELTAGDYFGERALLRDTGAPPAALAGMRSAKKA